MLKYDLEQTLHVTGAVQCAAGISASTGISSSYGFLNRLQINGGGTNNIKLKGSGEISGSGPLNIVGAATLESTLRVSGAISSAVGLTGSSLEINDAGIWNANGNLRAAGFISSSVGLTGSSLLINDVGLLSLPLNN